MIIVINALLLQWSLSFVGYKIHFVENILLTGYSSIVNFFGPLQSGPGVRAVYLKKKHGVKIKDFSVTLVIFYVFFAAINGAVILWAVLSKYSSPTVSVMVTLGIILLTILAVYMARKSPVVNRTLKRARFTDRNLWLIALCALLLILTTVFIYTIELIHLTDISLPQAFIYTAVANFSLFVSLTPGAIGFRESFVLLSQQLHKIDTESIISANIIDRAFYIIFLLGLFLILLAVNAKMRSSVFDKLRE